MTLKPALKPASAAALFALFATACQPTEKPGATASGGAGQPVAADAQRPTSQLAKFATGEFENLDTGNDLSLPTATFQDAAGKPTSFAAYAGKVVIYNVWAEWCAPCVEEMPSLVNLQKAFAGKDVAVVPVAFGMGKGVTRETTLAKFNELTKGELPFYYDGELEVNAQARTGALPSTIIYDKSGKEVARLVYPAKWDSTEAIALVQAILDGQS